MADQIPTPAQDALVEQLRQKGRNSRIYRMTMIGLALVLFVFLVCIALFLFAPTTATQLVGLAQIVVTGISGMIAVYTGSQALSDRATANALAPKT